jgi:hypothetical protein
VGFAGVKAADFWAAASSAGGFVPSGMVRVLTTRGGDDGINCLVVGDPDRGGGVGGWEEVARPLRRPSHYWAGAPNDTCSWQLAWDLTVQSGRSIEDRLTGLRAMGRPRGDEEEPPGIMVLGDVPRPDLGVLWKMDDLSLGARRYRPDAPTVLAFLAFTLTLSRLTEPDEVEAVHVSRSRTRAGKRKQRVYRTRKGDTLRGIAVRELGLPSGWADIRKWNPKAFKKVDPDTPLRANMRVVLK